MFSPTADRRFTTIVWLVLLVSLVAIPSVFPVQQLRATGGLLFYTNAFDETMYLSYDGATAARSLTYLAEYAVVALQHIGISGGYINFVADLLFPIVTALFLRLIARRCSFSAAESAVLPFVVIALPIVFGYSNPWYGQWYDKWHYGASSVRWLTLPQAYYPPFFRTPEPQLSLAVLSIATYLALGLRSYVVALVVTPFVYPFVGLPYAFVVLSLFVANRMEPLVRPVALRIVVAAGTAYTAIAAALWGYYQWFLKGTFQGDFLLKMHGPLVSGTGTLALIISVVGWRLLPGRLRVPAVLVALAPIAMANTQVISGFVMAPHNFEQYFGVVVIGVLLAMVVHAIERNQLLLAAAAVLPILLLTMYSREIIDKNASIWLRVPPSSSLRSVMRSAPERLVMNDSDLADTFVLMEARLHFFATSRAQTFWAGDVATVERFKRYQCTKALLSQRTPGVISNATLSNLDRSFKYLNTDFPLLTLGRTSALRDMFDPSEPAGACPHRALELFPALELGATLPDDGLRARLDEALRLNRVAAAGDVTTPKMRWSYAGVAKFSVGDSRLVDVRVESRVERGCLGLGVVKSDLMTYETEKELIPSGSTQTADLMFDSRRDDTYFFVVRNCSPDGPSSGLVEAIRIFAVNAVSAAPL